MARSGALHIKEIRNERAWSERISLFSSMRHESGRIPRRRRTRLGIASRQAVENALPLGGAAQIAGAALSSFF